MVPDAIEEGQFTAIEETRTYNFEGQVVTYSEYLALSEARDRVEKHEWKRRDQEYAAEKQKIEQRWQNTTMVILALLFILGLAFAYFIVQHANAVS